MISCTTERLNVAVAQPLVVPGNVPENVRRMRPLVAEAAARGSHLVLFSECGITGYDLKGAGIDAAIPLSDRALQEVSRLARQNSIAIVTGFHEQYVGEVYNAAVAFLPDGSRVVQRKHKLNDHEAEATPVRAGERQRMLFEVGGVRLAMLLSSDSGVEGIYEEIRSQGGDAILLMMAGCGSGNFAFRQQELADPISREAYLKASESVCFMREAVERVLLHGMGLAACNQAGWEESCNYFHPGHSFVIDRTGEVTALIPGRFVVEHLRPDLAMGFIHGPAR